MANLAQKRDYCEKSYYLVDGLVPAHMLDEMHAAASRIKAKVRAGEASVFTHEASEGEPWAIGGLYSPVFGEKIFSEYMQLDSMLEHVHAFLGEELYLGYMNLLTNPYHKDNLGGWHRDNGFKSDPTYDDEMKFLQSGQTDFRWHLALEDDECLHIVPESRHRYRTEIEREHMVEGDTGPLPGQEIIRLRRGQTLFWNARVIHRGATRKDVERLTIAASWKKYESNLPEQETHRQLLWRLEPEVREFLPEKMRLYYDRWVSLQKHAS